MHVFGGTSRLNRCNSCGSLARRKTPFSVDKLRSGVTRTVIDVQPVVEFHADRIIERRVGLIRWRGGRARDRPRAHEGTFIIGTFSKYLGAAFREFSTWRPLCAHRTP